MVPLALAALAWMSPSFAAAHPGHVDEAPWDARVERSLDDACAWTVDANRRARGTCRQMGGALVCVRNRPFEPDATGDAPNAQRSVTGFGLHGATPWILGAVVAALACAWQVRRRVPTTRPPTQ